jgi:D-serine dehydratase
MVDLREVEDFLIDDRVKGIPGGIASFSLRDIGRQGWNLLREDLPLPAAVLKASAIDNNSRWMMGFLGRAGAAIAPHGKTTMSPQLFQRQLSDGAWAITVATVHQLHVCRRHGFDRIFMANQLVGRPAIRYVIEELRRDARFEFYSLVDSVELVDQLALAAREQPPGRPLNLLVEAGVPGGRAGCRDLGGALAVAEAVSRSAPLLALRGVEGFEGLITGATFPEQEQKVRSFLRFIGEIAEASDRRSLFAPGPVILSAGGSAFYDLVTDVLGAVRLARETMLLTRSGCYLTHDSAMYRRFYARLCERAPDFATAPGEGLLPALELWAYIQSRPEPGKAILTLGRRDAGHDADLPIPEYWFRPGRDVRPQSIPPACRLTGMNDQHAHMALPEDSPIAVGDMVGFGISHPCTTFDKWQLILVVDDEYEVVSAVRTFF